jgi:glucose/mannose-6-phosphate isomerase
MLDDLKFIHEKDAQDALGIAEKQWQQLAHTYTLQLPQAAQIKNIVFAGMGGSALAAQISITWPGYTLPFEVCRQYDIPPYVGPETLFIASSYSGNTEETLSALAQAEAKGAQVVVIASGGKLQQIATEKGHPFELLPPAGQPRFGVLYSLKALVTILEKAGLVAADTAEQALHEAADFLQTSVQAWLPTVPTKDNIAKQMALECMGKSPVIYAGPELFPAAYKWKISFNESAKNIAWCNQLPEFNHNEFLGWTSHPTDKPYTVIDLRSSFEHERIKKRFEVTERLLSGRRPAAHVVEAQGETLLEHLLWSIALGDFVSLYLALLNGLNPTPVDLIEKLKVAMQQ